LIAIYQAGKFSNRFIFCYSKKGIYLAGKIYLQFVFAVQYRTNWFRAHGRWSLQTKNIV